MPKNVNFEGSQKYFLSPEMISKIKKGDYKPMEKIPTTATNNSISTTNVPPPKSLLSSMPAQTQIQNLQIKSPYRDIFARETQNDGLIGIIYNYLKNKTGIGLGSNKVYKAIQEYENGTGSKEIVEQKINKYKISRENAVQNTGDIAAGGITLGGFYFGAKYLNNFRGYLNLYSQLPEFCKKILKTPITENMDTALAYTLENAKINAKIIGFLKSNKQIFKYVLPTLAIAGGLTKYIVGKIDRISSSEFDTDRTLPPQEIKAQRKELKRQKRNISRMNFLTGALTGLLAPVTMLAGGLAGVPIYLAATSIIRYLTNRHDKKKLSPSGFIEFFKDNAILNTLSAAAIGAFAFKKANFNKVQIKNLSDVTNKLKDKVFSDLPQKTAMQDIQEKLFKDSKIQFILNNNTLSTENKIKALIDENIFAAKFLQIYEKDAGIEKIFGNYSELSKALKEDCPPSRTFEQAQELIKQKFNGKYELIGNNPIGVGTVAETYLAKDINENEFCIKILKEGMDAAKIERDKNKLISIITQGQSADKWNEDTKYLVRNIEDLSEAITKETNLTLEMDAADRIQKFCKSANVVRPVEVKDNAYVMERVYGISIKCVENYIYAKTAIQVIPNTIAKYEQLLTNPQLNSAEKTSIIQYINLLKQQLPECERTIQKIRSIPDFQDFDLTSKQIEKMLTSYNDLLNEQFIKLENGGKTIHGDLHTGNVLIDINALKADKQKCLTLIDTGNFIELTKEQAIKNAKLEDFINRGNAEELTNIVLEGAILPENLQKDEAYKLILQDIKALFFDDKTKCPWTNVSVFSKLSESILRQHNIIPATTNLNFAKAKQSADLSYSSLLGSLIGSKQGETTNQGAIGRTIGQNNMIFKLLIGIPISNSIKEKWISLKNIFKLGSLKNIRSHYFNPTNRKQNSQEYLNYLMKQSKEKIKIAEDIISCAEQIV